ncbi:hypothetical protein B7494_g387 [Chlorociboria aeruginascens]|nr:hypothetical protein B7494_g387 [Chlorociboria aeruginascens]
MLERTAGCLESTSLRRLLPTSKKPLKSRRTLHSAFWNHGVGELEFPPLWMALLRGPDQVESSNEKSSQSSLSNSQGGFLLDFLYPTGTINLLRQYSGWRVVIQDVRRSSMGLGKFGHRLYSTKDDSKTVDLEEGNSSGLVSYSRPLRELLGVNTSDNFEKAWQQYELLPVSEQIRMQPEIMDYLSSSSRILDAERVVDLFGNLDERREIPETYTIAIKAYLKLRNISAAVDLHKTALERFKSPAGSSELLAYEIDNSLWSQALSTWNEVQNFKEFFPQSDYKLYSELEKLPNLGPRVVELTEHIKQIIEYAQETPGSSVVGLQGFASAIMKTVLTCKEAFDYSIFNTLLGTLREWNLDNPIFYEKFFDIILSMKHTKFATQCYRRARRGRRIRFTHRVLYSILNIFCRYHSVIGMQEILDDFFSFYGTPPRKIFQMCMTEFAAMGDAETVKSLFETYLNLFKLKSGNSLDTADDFAPLLNVHAKRGEVAEVVRVFNQIKDKYGLCPTTLCWNILISAYAKVRDVDAAFACFEQVLASEDDMSKPDDYTFGTIMGICVDRGDLESTIEVFRLSERLGIKKSTAMVDCLVLAHIRDDRVERAESICAEAIGMNLKGPSLTRMWNYLLVVYALRRDLDNVNRILRRMSDFNLDYDAQTYSALMQALCMVKQPERAYAVLQDVMIPAGIPATHFHYAVVMGGFLAAGSSAEIFRVRRDMVRHNTRKSASTDLFSLKAIAIDDLLLESGMGHTQLQRATQLFEELLSTFSPQDISDTRRKGSGRLPVNVAFPSMFYSYMMFIFAQCYKHDTVYELYDRLRAFLPKHRQDMPPIEILTPMMMSKLQEGDYETVSELWNLALSQAIEGGQPLKLPNALHSGNYIDSLSGAGIVLPFHKLSLARPLMIYMNALSATDRVDELINLVGHLQEIGFVLDNKNWNHYIQLLTQKFRYKTAFALCESKLMDGWTGWASVRWKLPERNRLDLKFRNMRKAPLHLRPKYHTILYLARAYLELQDKAAESRGAQVNLDDIENACPKTLNAIKTMQRTDSDLERKILRR